MLFAVRSEKCVTQYRAFRKSSRSLYLWSMNQRTKTV